ncbi:Conserved_hypothetical protein [Hexamita inflata]|uniref:Leucine-rich repeat protein n=1 Tax=Hexamita inflata TaxID=28002 RepID=A0AA86R5Y6_9EUKA|nr:Conserved hypothetical protein [Hexamita inflata]
MLHLDVSYNKLKSIEQIITLTNLQYLDIGNNQICSLSGVQNMYNLCVIEAKCNLINDLAYIPQQQNLTTLHLEHNQISQIKQIKQLKYCIYLTELSFGHVNQNSIPSIQNQQNINQICYDSSYPLFVIKELPQLQLLDYDDNQGDYGPENIYKYISETQRQIARKQYYDDVEQDEFIVE